MTGDPGGRPGGRPTHISPREKTTERRALELENAGAESLAREGYRIKQNPSAEEVAHARLAAGDSGRASARPDYLLEGRIFDCYSPRADTSPRNAWSAVREKIEDQQTQRIVLNLEDWKGDLTALRKQFDEWPIEGLRELKIIIPGGGVLQMDLPQA